MNPRLSRIERVTVRGFKTFNDEATLTIAPLTLVLGRNGSGKSLLSRLPLFASAGLSSDGHGLPMNASGLSLGTAFIDLCPGRMTGHVELELTFSGACPGVLRVRLGPDVGPSPPQRIHAWHWKPEAGTALSLEWTRPGDLYRQGEEIRPVRFHGLLPDLGPKGPPLPRVAAPSHLGPYRLGIPPFAPLPERLTRDLGVDGAQAGVVLASHALLGQPAVLDRVTAWYRDHLGFELRLDDFSSEATGRLFGLAVRAIGRDAWINLAHVGTGTATVLPFVVQHALTHANAGTESRPDLLVCEEPEAHLHPSAQAELADLAVETAGGGRARVLVETHSETLLLRVRRRVAEGRIDASKVQLLWVDDEGPNTRAVRLELGTDGWVNDWPAGLFSEARFEAQALARAISSEEP